jgi:hypothetical protein
MLYVRKRNYIIRIKSNVNSQNLSTLSLLCRLFHKANHGGTTTSCFEPKNKLLAGTENIHVCITEYVSSYHAGTVLGAGGTVESKSPTMESVSHSHWSEVGDYSFMLLCSFLTLSTWYMFIYKNNTKKSRNSDLALTYEIFFL